MQRVMFLIWAWMSSREGPETVTSEDSSNGESLRGVSFPPGGGVTAPLETEDLEDFLTTGSCCGEEALGGRSGAVGMEEVARFFWMGMSEGG